MTQAIWDWLLVEDSFARLAQAVWATVYLAALAMWIRAASKQRSAERALGVAIRNAERAQEALRNYWSQQLPLADLYPLDVAEQLSALRQIRFAHGIQWREWDEEKIATFLANAIHRRDDAMGRLAESSERALGVATEQEPLVHWHPCIASFCGDARSGQPGKYTTISSNVTCPECMKQHDAIAAQIEAVLGPEQQP